MTQNTTKKFTNRSNVTQNTTHWKLIWRRTYIPDPALPANAPASENKRSADDFGGRKNWQRLMDGGWLKAIDRFYCRNSVGLISAKYCSDAKWYTRHGGVIFSPSHSFAEKGKMLPLTYDDGLSGWSFFSPKYHGLSFFVYQSYYFLPAGKKKDSSSTWEVSGSITHEAFFQVVHWGKAPSTWELYRIEQNELRPETWLSSPMAGVGRYIWLSQQGTLPTYLQGNSFWPLRMRSERRCQELCPLRGHYYVPSSTWAYRNIPHSFILPYLTIR
jgi:hypothetical protein